MQYVCLQPALHNRWNANPYMKIQDQNLTGTSASQLNRTQSLEGVGRSYRPNSARDASLDRVEVSDMADRVLNLIDMEARQRAAHVDRIRQAYQSGQFRANPDAIARGLLLEATQNQRDTTGI